MNNNIKKRAEIDSNLLYKWKKGNWRPQCYTTLVERKKHFNPKQRAVCDNYESS